MNQIRQGDVLLVAVHKLPPANVKPSHEVILAEGELTGHAHRLTGCVLEWNVGQQRYVRILGTEPGILSHEDHDPTPAAIVTPETTYRVIPQQETDLSGQWRKVQD